MAKVEDLNGITLDVFTPQEVKDVRPQSNRHYRRAYPQ
jgi:hypothetical protein